MSKRSAVLWTVAERYTELVDPLNGPGGLRGDGGAVSLMPTTYTATVREFERLLGLMRNQGYQQAVQGVKVATLRWHVLHWHINVDRVQKLVPTRKKARGGKSLTVFEPRIIVRRHPDAREARARLGVEWMADRWGLRSEPMLPDEIRELVAA